MLFNSRIIFHGLQKYLNIERIVYGDCNEVRTTMFYNHFFQMDHHIVLVHAADLADCIARVEHSALICMEKPEVIPDAGTNDLLVLNDDYANLICYNMINHIISRHLEWENNMNDILYNRGSIHDMINQISDLLDTPVALIDKDMQYIAYSDSSTELMNLVDENDRLPSELARSLLLREDFHQLEERKEAFFYVADKKCVYKNIFHEGKYIGRLSTMITNNQEDVEYHQAIFDQAGHFVEVLYQQFSSFNNKKSLLNNLHQILSDILRRQAVNYSELDTLLSLFGALPDDLWDVAVVVPVEKGSTNYGADYVCSQIEHLYADTVAFCLNGEILVFRNRSIRSRQPGAGTKNSTGTGDSGGTEDIFQEFIPSYSLKAGISRPFLSLTDMNHIIHAREQAAYAVYSGIDSRTRIINRFDDSALDYILKHDITQNSPAQLCHPALLFLKDYDQQHSTNYVETLQQFVLERYNAVSASKNLSIHRTSFINRMNRIRELTGLDFDDPRERLYLELSYYLYGDK